MRLVSAVPSHPHNSDLVPSPVSGHAADSGASAIQSLLEVFSSIDRSLKRIADKVDPPPDDKPVGTPYVAKLLGMTTTWVAEMAASGVIPKSCIVTGTGNGKPWKFHRQQIERWIQSR